MYVQFNYNPTAVHERVQVEDVILKHVFWLTEILAMYDWALLREWEFFNFFNFKFENLFKTRELEYDYFSTKRCGTKADKKIE